MSDLVLSGRDVRAFASAVTRRLSPRRAARMLRKSWRAYWDYQARRAVAVLLYVLDEDALAGIVIGRDECEWMKFGTAERLRPWHNENCCANSS